MPGWKTWMTFKNEAPATNAIVVASKEEAEAAGKELMTRWYVPTGYEARTTLDEPNYFFDFEQQKLVALVPEIGKKTS